MRVPVTLSLSALQEAIRDIHERLRQTVGSENTGAHPNVKGKRITNAGDAINDTDLVTLKQLKAYTGAAEDATVGDVAAAGDTGAPGGSTGTPGTCNGTKPDYTSYVAAAKATLVAALEDLTGPCGAFKITKLAAKNIQAVDNTVGLLAKDSGTNCVVSGQGYSTDVLCFIDGGQYDILGASGDGDGKTEPNNHPQFNFILCGDPSLYRSPI